MSDVTFNSIPNDIIASKVAIELNSNVSALGSAVIPQKVVVIGQYDSAKTVTDYKLFELTGGLQEAKNKYGYGSMIALMVEKVIKNAGSTIPVYIAPIPDAEAGVKATGTIAVSGTVTKSGVFYFYIAGRKVAVAVAKDDDASAQATAIKNAVNAILDLPVVATSSTSTVTITAKWKGLTGNDITIKQNIGGIEEVNAAPTGVTITITAMASGATNPVIDSIFEQLGGSIWYTVIVNPYTDATSLTALEDASEDLSDPLIKRFPNCISATTAVLATAQALAYGRNARFNTIVHADSSPNLPCEVASAAAGKVAWSAQIDPSRPFKTLLLEGILPGEKLTYAQIDASEKKGLATTDITADNRVKIYDLVTTYKTNGSGAADDSYRYTVTISNLQAKIYSLDAVLNAEPFVRAKIVDDNAVTSQRYAISPKVLKGFVLALVDDLWIPQAWSKNRDDLVASIQVNINATNPNRLDVGLTDILVCGERIIAVNYGYAFTPVS